MAFLRVTPALGETAHVHLLEPLGVHIRPERDVGPGEQLQVWTDAQTLSSSLPWAPSVAGAHPTAATADPSAWHAEPAARHSGAEYRAVLVAVAAGACGRGWGVEMGGWGARSPGRPSSHRCL